MSQIVSDACRLGGARNALILSDFRDNYVAKVSNKAKQSLLLAAFEATFSMPSDAGMETELLRGCLRRLAKVESKESR